MEYILYCDESSDKGPKYGDFFGGCLVDIRDVEEITEALNKKKQELNIRGEMKWTKVTEQYLDKYVEFITLFFQYIKDGKVKMRIMFRNMEDKPTQPYSADQKYYKLYYQFIKQAFGLKNIPTAEEVYLRIYLDQLPDKREASILFKRYVQRIL